MQTYPIAGQLLEQKLLFGISIRDLADVFAIPFVLMGVASFAGVSDVYYILLGGVGVLVSFAILFATPPAQRPRRWVWAALRYHAGSNTYLNRPVERERERGMVQDVVVTHGHDESTASSIDE